MYCKSNTASHPDSEDIRADNSKDTHTTELAN